MFFADLETTGLNCQENQSVELAIVEFRGGVIDYNGGFHCYVDHKNLNFNVDALLKFGDRIRDRKIGVPVYAAADVATKLSEWLNPRFEYSQKSIHSVSLNMGGKNFAAFDLGFLKVLIPGFERIIKHRSSDLGNKYEDRDDEHLPDLETCRKRALKSGVKGFYVDQPVTHTALEDAALCAELYKGWYDGLLGDALNPTWR